MGVQLVKQLLFKRQVDVNEFIYDYGLSYEALRRDIKKINRQIQNYQIQISLSPNQIRWQGDESSIRIFYHRLILPFTHHSFFFSDYSFQQENYGHFLKGLERKDLWINNEEIFGRCWFFINTIRQRAACPIESFTYNPDDYLFQLYQGELIQLYAYEGVSLAQDELFFAFFCFMDSWNYDLSSRDKQRIASHYPRFMAPSQRFVKILSEEFNLSGLAESKLAENLALFLLKYFESKRLSDKFMMEYHDILEVVQTRFPEMFEFVNHKMVEYGMQELIPNTHYASYTAVLIIQEAIYSMPRQQMTAYFVFQGEPAWKNYLFQELKAILGNRVHLKMLNKLDEFEQALQDPHDFIIANYTFPHAESQKIIYISSVPTAKEMENIRQAVQKLYL